jgi:hypothetical protein
VCSTCAASHRTSTGTPEDYANAFAQEGLRVAAMPLLMERFVPLPVMDGRTAAVQDMLESATRHTIIFRFSKP